MKQVCVIGSINLDIVLEVDSCPKAGESIFAKKVGYNCGGKGANAAIALQKLGVKTNFYGCVGKDTEATRLLENLDKAGLDVRYIRKKDTNSGMAYIILEKNSENRIIVVPGANEAVTAKDIQNDVLPLIKKSDLVLIQLEISVEAIESIVRLCKEKNKKLVVDAGPVRGITASQLAHVFCISPNKTELEALVQKDISTQLEIENAAKELLEYGVEQVLVKLGAKGCVLVTRQETIWFPAYKVHTVDTTAAGDSFMAGYCSALLEKMPIKEALAFASKCGAIAVTRKGAAPSLPSRDDINNFPSFC